MYECLHMCMCICICLYVCLCVLVVLCLRMHVFMPACVYACVLYGSMHKCM